MTVALATETVEAAIRSSFATSAATLDTKVTESFDAFGKRIDALHGSTYGHLTKTTLLEFARRLDALEARTRPPTPLPPCQNRPL